jgi:hypothetical protein
VQQAGVIAGVDVRFALTGAKGSALVLELSRHNQCRSSRIERILKSECLGAWSVGVELR